MGKVDPAAAAKAAAPGRVAVAGRPVLPAHAGTLDEDPHFLAAVELFRMGFLEAVGPELLASNRAQQSAEALKLVVYLLDRAGEARTAHWVARTALKRELGGRISEENRALWEMAYPPAFRDLVERHARAAKIDPDLLQGLMREESALDPRAVSWAGALGLTQLMPFTAKAVARKLKLRAPSREALFDPELNLQLGATFLGDLVSQFNGELRYAVGSYNAGPNAIRGWLNARRHLETDEWVEEIPIAETRGYVKRVLRSYTVYQLLGGAAATAPELRAVSGGGVHPAEASP
jgi:soluble lytic murein transglycosylase